MSDAQYLKREAVIASLPDEWQVDLMPQIRASIQTSNTKIVVLDDDPTGTQTVHDIHVLTIWTVEALQTELTDDASAVFILTNTRSMTSDAAKRVNHEIAENLLHASQATGRDFVIVSRSDSTLRGHFPDETDSLTSSLSMNVDGILIIPAFMAGGRVTINSVHYVTEGDELIPAAETPFAQDAVFGYQNSNLRKWVSEKTQGNVSPENVAAITISEIRDGGAERVAERLLELENRTYCVFDAITERDIEVLTLAILQAEAQGKHFLYRTAASFAAIRAGIALRPLLTNEELVTKRLGGGLTVVGSYVPKSSSQLSHLLDSGLVTGIAVSVSLLLDDTTHEEEIQRVCEAAVQLLQAGSDIVIYTTRTLITGDDAAQNLSIGNRISDSLVEITSRIQKYARYIIAKGGITSSDLATKALVVKRALVIGQILPGIPVWRLDKDCAEPDLTYVVFPGNVGQIDSLTQAVAKFKEDA